MTDKMTMFLTKLLNIQLRLNILNAVGYFPHLTVRSSRHWHLLEPDN